MTYKGNDNCVISQVFMTSLEETYCDVSLPYSPRTEPNGSGQVGVNISLIEVFILRQ